MSSPTDEQIICVKDNIRNLITFNDELYYIILKCIFILP